MKSKIKALLFAAIFSVLSLSGFNTEAVFLSSDKQDDSDPEPSLDSGYQLYLPVIQKPRPADEFQMVQRFAPVLAFDGSYQGLPMSAEVYFQSMMVYPGGSPVIIGGGITWLAEWITNQWGYGPFTDVAGFAGASYYPSIQASDVNGDGQAELLARNSCGMETWHLQNYIFKYWHNIADCNPEWSDTAGWGAEKYNRTIQTADVNGDGQSELLGRSACGIETWHFNSTNKTWQLMADCDPAWGDLEGWGENPYYSTIQTADVNGDGQAELLGRSACGMNTMHFNTSLNTWESLASCSPEWSDVAGWSAEKYTRTIQTADVNGDGQAELLGRSACGMETWHFNTSSNTWQILASCNPDWSDAGSWGEDKYYSTIQAADVNKDGQAELLARAWCGIETWHFNTDINTWEMMASCDPALGDSQGWGGVSYYSTIQTADINGDRQAELIGRHGCGMLTYHFNANTNIWEGKAGCTPGFTDPNWTLEQFYSTIQTADVDGDNQAELLARSQLGMSSFDYSDASLWQLQSPLFRIKLNGRDWGQYGLSNGLFSTLTDGKTPTYYRVIYHPTGMARISYWWFYGFQAACNVDVQAGADGAHHGDWEHIEVTTSEDRSRIIAVTYYFHDASYTRLPGGFSVVGERPVVYVGKLGHGSYHSQDCSGWMVGTPSHCCHYADYRNNNVYTNWDTSSNLVNLDKNEESWMLADRFGSQYTFKGKTYTIANWYWGPHHEYCAFGDENLCFDWVEVQGPWTHPTVSQLDWMIPSCTGEGCPTSLPRRTCEGLVYDCETDFDQGWPWAPQSLGSPDFLDPLNLDLPTLTGNCSSIGEP